MQNCVLSYKTPDARDSNKKAEKVDMYRGLMLNAVPRTEIEKHVQFIRLLSGQNSDIFWCSGETKQDFTAGTFFSTPFSKRWWVCQVNNEAAIVWRNKATIVEWMAFLFSLAWPVWRSATPLYLMYSSAHLSICPDVITQWQSNVAFWLFSHFYYFHRWVNTRQS